MAPKLSDHDSTSEEEITELETFSEDEEDFDSSLSEEDGDQEYKDEEDSCESDQGWGFDSFDDTDYESTDEEEDDDDNDFIWNRYLCHVYYSKGFKVDREIVPDRPYLGFSPFDFDAKFYTNVNSREYMDNMVKLSLDRYNKENGTNVKCEYVVRVVVKWDAGLKSYITFMARESPDQDDLVEYQAKTQRKVWQRNAHAILCRPALPMKPIPQKYLPNQKGVNAS